MKILFIHEVSWLKKVAYEIHDFPELLSLKGHDVTFVEYDEGDGVLESSSEIIGRGLLSVRRVASRSHSGSRVQIITPKRWIAGICGRLLATLIHPLVITTELIRRKPDVVVLYGVPTNGWQTAILAKFFQISLVFRAIDVSHQIRDTKFSSLIKRAESIITNRTDLISTHNLALKKYFCDLGIAEEKVKVLLPGVDLVRFHPLEQREEARNLYNFKTSDKVIMFMGTVFRFSGLYELIETSAHLFQQDSSLKLLILGDGEDLIRISDLVNEKNLTAQILMPGRIPYKDLNFHMQAGNIAVLPFLKAQVTDLALPGKVLQYLASGLPTVSTGLKGIQSVLPEGNGVIYADSHDQFIFEVFRIINDQSLMDALALDGRNAMERKCSWKDQILEFENELLRVAQVRKRS